MPITLYIVRHAKAEDRAQFMADHDRELTSEGAMDAARMGHYLHDKGIRPDIIISSYGGPRPRYGPPDGRAN